MNELPSRPSPPTITADQHRHIAEYHREQALLDQDTIDELKEQLAEARKDLRRNRRLANISARAHERAKAKEIVNGLCQHEGTEKKDGPRMPLRYGSLATQVCSCGAWRALRDLPDGWDYWRREPLPDPNAEFDDDF